MAYKGPRPTRSPAPEIKGKLLKEYFDFCEKSYAKNPETLSIKLPRKEFAATLDSVEAVVRTEALALLKKKSVKDFLKKAALPPGMAPFLPDEVRVYCLLINALKQWVVAQSIATDGVVFGSSLRKTVRASAKHCVITGEPLTYQAVELHHVVRDGRPPIPLSHKGHSKVDRQFRPELTDPIGCALAELRKKKRKSWKDLLTAIERQSGLDAGNPNRLSKLGEDAVSATGKSASDLLVWMEESGLKDLLIEK